MLASETRSWQRTVTFRGAAFVALFAAQQLTWQALRGTWVERVVIHDATVRPAAFLVNAITPHVRAAAAGFSLIAPGGGLNILNGCEGTEALFLLTAAFAIAPIAARSRALGLLLGIAVVFLVNQLRILALFYSYRARPATFELLHGTVTPILVVLAVSGYFYAWLAREARTVSAAG